MDERVYARYMSNLSYFMDKLEEKKTSKYHLPIALSYLKLEKYEEAVAVCNTALELFPNHCPTKTLLAEGYIYLGELDIAKEVLFEVISEDEDNYKALKLLAFTMKQLNNNDSAIKYYKAAYFLAPEDEELLENLNNLGESIDLDQILAIKNKNPKKESLKVEGATSFPDISQSIKNAELMIEDLAKDIKGNEAKFDEDYIDKFIDTSLTQLEEISKNTITKKQPTEDISNTSLSAESEQEIKENISIDLNAQTDATDILDIENSNEHKEKNNENTISDELEDIFATNIEDTNSDNTEEKIIDDKLITEDEFNALLSVVDTSSFDDEQQNSDAVNPTYNKQNNKNSPESELASLLEAVDDTTSMKDNSDILGLADDLEEITKSREPLQLDNDIYLDNRTGNILVNLYDIQNDNQAENYINFSSDIDDDNEFFSSNKNTSNQPISIDLGDESPFHQEDIFSEILSSVNTDIDTFGADKDKIDASTDKVENIFTLNTLSVTTEETDENIESNNELDAQSSIQKFNYDIDKSENENLFSLDNIIEREELATDTINDITSLNEENSIDTQDDTAGNQNNIIDTQEDTIHTKEDTTDNLDDTIDSQDDIPPTQGDTIDTINRQYDIPHTQRDIIDTNILTDTSPSNDKKRKNEKIINRLEKRLEEIQKNK